MRFVFYGRHQQAIGLDGTGALIALLTLVAGFGAAYVWYGPVRRGAALAANRRPAAASGRRGLLRRAIDGIGGTAVARDRGPGVEL